MRFRDLYGNSQALATLRNMVDTNAIPHALLLSGPAGTGKMLAARTFAQYVHCKHSHDGEPCGECAACRLHEKNSHPDLHYVFPIIKKEKEKLLLSDDYAAEWQEYIAAHPLMPFEEWSNAMDKGSNTIPKIYVTESEEIIRAASLSPFVADKKIFIIWLPEQMQVEAANKLLKIIEEPYDDTLFVMVSDSPQMLLATILSRTQGISFPRLADAEVAEYMVSRCGVAPATASELAPVANGSLIAAENLLLAGTETEAFRAIFQDMMRKAYMKDVNEMKKISEKIADFKREKIRRFLTYCASQIRENFIYNLQVPELNAMTEEDKAFSARFAPFINERNVERLSAETDRAITDIERNGNAKIVLFDYLLQLLLLLRL